MADTSSFDQIRALVRELNEVSGMALRHQKKNNAVDKLMLAQFRQRQQRIAKELLIVILQSDLSLKNTDEAVRSIFEFLKKRDHEELISSELKSNLNEVSRALAS